MSLEIKGKIIAVLEEKTGEGKNGKWHSQDAVIETDGQYPKKVCVSLWGDKIDQFSLKPGENVTMGIDVESREYNGRWYTEVKAYKVDRAGSSGSSSSDIPEVDSFHSEGEEDRLPF